jgi:RNA polymerase sigma-70 factor, ECF subfamily
MTTVRLSELKLIKSIRDGDKDAFRLLFDQYFAPLFDYASTLVKYPEPAEEIVQETFIRLWENRMQLNIDISVRAYLYRSIHNNCISYFRNRTMDAKHSKIIREEISYHAGLAMLNFSENILDTIITGELESHLNRVIEGLPDQCRKIFCMSRYDHLSYQEIAEKLGISVNTVKTQLSRAFEKLREARDHFEEK